VPFHPSCDIVSTSMPFHWVEASAWLETRSVVFAQFQGGANIISESKD